MFAGDLLLGAFDNDGVAPDVEHWNGRVDPLADGSSFSLDFDLGIPDESPTPAHVTLSFAVAGGGAYAAYDLIGHAELAAGKASLSEATSLERAGLQATREAPELAPEANIARQAQMAADGGTPEIPAGLRPQSIAVADRESEVSQAAKAWYKSTSPSEEASLVRHHLKHVTRELGDNPLGLGTTPGQYTRDAQKFFAFYRESTFAQPVTLADRTSGILIRLGEGLPGGYFTPEGRIVTFWYVAEV